ncbi:MmgE/PrpD family protein [Bordetella holmesii]|uniref:MmgE/PrpD family protein n=1 Tax=Bordetella holmesii TaxID=35814 RepID=UPI000459A962|nr:MmgE/PrpD family protein [Bordetella holmesii]KCV10628.1 MmgE/PrpD family protein [Bordetella holmesii 04P3421]QGF01425.1 MmgE/PrpD family protein [Bordetella holmesii]
MSEHITLMSNAKPTRALAQWCAGLRRAHLPADCLQESSRHALDTLAACAAGMQQPLVRAAIELERRINPTQGTVPLFGGPQRWTVIEAAGLMAMACHALEMDDGNREGSIHPGTTIVPAVLALAWHTWADYLQFLTAVTAGYEVAISIAETLHPHASRRGFQTTPVAGVVGTAAACATLLGLEAEQIESAMGLPASAAGGLFAYLEGGGNVKKFHPAHAAREGLRAALMAQQGAAVGPVGSIEGPSGILEAFGGIQGWDGNQARARNAPAIMRSYLKPYPCCRHIHPAIDAILALKAEAGWNAADVESIEVCMFGAAMPHAQLPWNTLEIAQLSFPWVMALACLDGEVTLAGFSQQARARADVNALAAKVTVRQDEECDTLYPAYGPARVTLRLRSGRQFSKWVADPLGSADLPISDEALDTKAVQAFALSFASGRPAELIRMLRDVQPWPLVDLR